MSQGEMLVLTKSSIVDLKGLAHANQKMVWETPLKDLVAQHSLELVAVEVSYDPGHEFRIGKPRDRSFDSHNATVLKQVLPELTPSQATDERIWVTLALGDLKEYVLKRWDPGETDDYGVGSKIFVPNTRSLVRDHAIGRLWWRRHFASLVQHHKAFDPLALFFEYEDIPGEISGRSILTDAKVLSAYVIQIERGLGAITAEMVGLGLSPKKYIQGFGKQLNFLSGRFQIGAVSNERLFQFMEIAHERVVRQFRK